MPFSNFEKRKNVILDTITETTHSG